ncbi:MAG: tetraacyldisaccharide 4'-kinase [Deltaproteobacteria bacterium]|nr:tetraacyldisaccharide 4'-kinase [Deltaproteobacteria bacterium]
MLNKIKKKIENIMAGEGRSSFSSVEFLLFILSLFYGGLVKFRAKAYDRGIIKSKKLPCKVISIGNITVGGTGKTPMTIYVAELVQRLGYVVAVISRGYKGELEKTGGIVSNGKTVLMGPEKAGDEPFMLAGRLKNIPVIVGKDRFESGMQAVKNFNPDVIVLDDAFQHLKLKRDINLVLLDAKRPFGISHLLPRGILREPPSSLLRSDAFILTRSGCAPESKVEKSLPGLNEFIQSRPVFKTSHEPYAYIVKKGNLVPFESISRNSFLYDFEFLRDRRVFAFAGIARNDDFLHTVKSFKCDITNFLGFEDHHRYSDNDLNSMFSVAEKANVEFLITTEKDYARIANRTGWPTDLVVIGIEISFINDSKAFDDFMKTALSG